MTTGSAARWAAVLAYMAGLFFLSSLSNLPAPPAAGFDKLVHIALYAGLGLVSLRALAGGRWSGVTGGRAVEAVLIAVLYGGFDELHQSFVAGRTAEAADVWADLTGAALAMIAVGVWVILTGKNAKDATESEEREESGVSAREWGESREESREKEES